MSQEVSPADWKQLYIAAVLELDKDKLLSRIYEAKMAIFDRIEAIDRGGLPSERAALQRAMKALGELHAVYFGESPFVVEQVTAAQNQGRPQEAA